jgi:hypothetical protein
MSSGSQVPESTVEIIKKLHHAGQSHEFIRGMTGVDLEVVRQVLAQIDDPQLMQAMLAQAQQRSLRYRCSQSARLMRSPVQACNKKLYEKEVLEDMLKSGQNELISEGSSLAELHFVKENIEHFSKETLEMIEVCIVRMPEATLGLVSDCLSVLSAESDLPSFIKVFERLESSQLPQLLGLLQSKSSAELMQSLYCRLAEIEQLQPTVLAMSRLLLRGSFNEEAFGVFVGVVRRAAASSEVLSVALEVAESCSWNQLRPLKEELWSKNWDAEQWRLEELSLEEAEFRVKSGEDSAARDLLKAHKGYWAFKGKVLEFFDRVDWKQDKLEYLEQIYSRSLQTLKEQGLTPPLLEALETLYQIIQTSPESRSENRAEIEVNETPSVNLQEVSVNLRLVMKAADEFKTQQQTFDAQLQQLQRDSQAILQHSETKLQQQQRDSLAQLQQRQDSQAQLQAVLKSVNQLTTNEQGFIYNFQKNTSNLHKTNLSTGQESRTALTHTFKYHSSLCESPEGNLFITGGGHPTVTNEVMFIDPITNAVTPKPPMKTPRRGHGSVFYGGFLYVIGGYNTDYLAECERYDTLHNQWQHIPPLPHQSECHAAIVCGYTRRIYTLGGSGDLYSDLIEEFELESQTWKLLELKLPSKSWNIPCFRVKNQALIYFIQDSALHSFSPITYTLANVKPVKDIQSWNGPSYFAKGTLYYPVGVVGPLQKLEIGDLS